MKKAFLFLLAIALISTFAGTLYYLYSKSEAAPEVFETDAPRIATIVQKTVATGSVVPRKEIEIKPQVSGLIARLHVEPGQLVQRGSLIADIDIIPNMVTLNNAETRLNRARISMDNARRDLERNRRLQLDGAISEAGFQQVEMNFDNAEEELASAVDNLELIRKGTTKKQSGASNTKVRSTLTGMVLDVPIEEGDSVIESNTFNDGTTIATVADMQEMIFEGKLDESEVGKIRPGMSLLLTIGAMEDQRFEAKLEHIAPKGIEEDGAIQFEIRAALNLDKDQFIRANLSANADIVLDRRDDVLALDEGLLQFDGDTTYVEVETAPQQFERRDIETGLSDGIRVEVLSGVSEEDRIKKPG